MNSVLDSFQDSKTKENKGGSQHCKAAPAVALVSRRGGWHSHNGHLLDLCGILIVTLTACHRMSVALLCLDLGHESQSETRCV